MNPTTKLAIEFATMIANGWTSNYYMSPADNRHNLVYKFWNYDGANGFDSYTSGSTSSDCSAFITLVWAVATATAYKSPIARDNTYVNGRKIVPLSRNIVDANRPNTVYCPSTEQMIDGNGIFQGFVSYGFERVSSGSYLKPGDVCVIQQATGAEGHTFMILEPDDGDWYWDGNQKTFKVVHCASNNNPHAIRIQTGWGIIANDGRTPTVLRYTYEH